MAKQSEEQKIGDQGHEIVKGIITLHGGWIARSQEKDFGIDVEAEISEPAVRGELLKIQIKTSETVERTGKNIKVGIERKYFDLAASFRYPLIFVVVELTTRKAWYLWLQEYLVHERKKGNRLADFPGKKTIMIPLKNQLSKGLGGRLKEIAAWKEETQMLLSILDTVRTAIATKNAKALVELAKLISEVDKSHQDFPVEVVIDEILEISERNPAAWELGQSSYLLVQLLLNFGNRVSRNDVLRMVLRNEGESFSRTGVLGLGTLYDYFPEHVAKMDLIEEFEKRGLVQLVYYCRLREKYSGITGMSLAMGDYDYTIGDLTLYEGEYDGWLGNKWANRGDAVFVDCIVQKES